MSIIRGEIALTIHARSLTMPESKLTFRAKHDKTADIDVEFVRRNAGDVNCLKVLCGGNLSDAVSLYLWCGGWR